MQTNLEKYKKDLENLIKQGFLIQSDLLIQYCKSMEKPLKDIDAQEKLCSGAFKDQYQGWYTETYVIIKQLLPDRLNEFEALYKRDAKRKAIDNTTYSLQDWFQGITAAKDYTGKKYFDDIGTAYSRFETQLKILESLRRRFESSLFDIRQLVQADLFDSEIDATRELLKHKFLRAAGAVAGVVLEKHLAQVCVNHSIAIKKQHPTIGDLNDLLKNADAIDQINWRFIQRLGDLRNLCDHNKKREPTESEVDDLISGVDKTIKTVF
ncbi:MAG: hypothetical protein KGI29_09300 [Pseudomonadota bacterium]|nr:hypothetical protein [Pseudomonadota bacterium]MDE3038206.1 hypothetical protein [Pseudomonadota bacterium]